MSMEIETLNKRIQVLTNENNRLYTKLKTQQRKNTRLRNELRKNGVVYECDKNIKTRDLIVENNTLQEVLVDSNESSSVSEDGTISDDWEDTSMEISTLISSTN